VIGSLDDLAGIPCSDPSAPSAQGDVKLEYDFSSGQDVVKIVCEFNAPITVRLTAALRAAYPGATSMAQFITITPSDGALASCAPSASCAVGIPHNGSTAVVLDFPPGSPLWTYPLTWMTVYHSDSSPQTTGPTAGTYVTLPFDATGLLFDLY